MGGGGGAGVGGRAGLRPEAASVFGMFPTRPVDPPNRQRLMQALVCVSEPTCLLRCICTVYDHKNLFTPGFLFFFKYIFMLLMA